MSRQILSLYILRGSFAAKPQKIFSRILGNRIWGKQALISLPSTITNARSVGKNERGEANFLGTNGFASPQVTKSCCRDNPVEVGVIGIDGLVGLPIVLGGGGVPEHTFVQIEGSGFRIDANLVKEQYEQPGELRRRLQKYVLANLLQSAQNAACNRLHTIGERLSPMASHLP
jgi:hypothetical protein